MAEMTEERALKVLQTFSDVKYQRVPREEAKEAKLERQDSKASGKTNRSAVGYNMNKTSDLHVKGIKPKDSLASGGDSAWRTLCG